MKYVQPHKLKVLMLMFFGTGGMGIIIGLSQPSQVSFFITFMGVINICLGGFMGWIFFTQEPRLRDKRKE
jgi:hypothetical protein